MSSHKELVISLYQIGAIQFGEFVLKSGQKSLIYINLRKIISYPALMRTIANLMWEKIANTKFDLICGVPYTALPIATCLSIEHNIPMVMRRKEKKDYGTKQLIEGVYQPGQTCLVIEDVITTGSSIIETAHDLQQIGLKVNNMVALIDREQGGKQNCNQQYQLQTVITLSEIWPVLIESKLLSDESIRIIETFRNH